MFYDFGDVFQCVDLLMKNHKSPPEEQLPISAFDLDQTTRDKRVEETHKICKKTDEDLKALIYAQNKLCETLKKRFWDPVEVKGRKLRVIYCYTYECCYFILVFPPQKLYCFLH